MWNVHAVSQPWASASVCVGPHKPLQPPSHCFSTLYSDIYLYKSLSVYCASHSPFLHFHSLWLTLPWSSSPLCFVLPSTLPLSSLSPWSCAFLWHLAGQRRVTPERWVKTIIGPLPVVRCPLPPLSVTETVCVRVSMYVCIHVCACACSPQCVLVLNLACCTTLVSSCAS